MLRCNRRSSNGISPNTDPYCIDILLAFKTNKGVYSTSSCPLKGIALLGGIAAIVSQYCAIPRHQVGTVILTVINSQTKKSVAAIPQLIVREDFWNYEVGIGNP